MGRPAEAIRAGERIDRVSGGEDGIRTCSGRPEAASMGDAEPARRATDRRFFAAGLAAEATFRS
jgi:hypothetical protein